MFPGLWQTMRLARANTIEVNYHHLHELSIEFPVVHIYINFISSRKHKS